MRTKRRCVLSLLSVAVGWWITPGTVCAAHDGFTWSAAQTQPADAHTSDALKLPAGQAWLGTVRLPVKVMADGQPLSAGTYRVRLTGEHAKEHAAGQAETLERWVEFVQGGKVRGRAMAPIVPAARAQEVADRALPARGAVRVEHLKEDNYYRLWFNYQGDQVLIYLPAA